MLNFGDDCIFSRVFPVYDSPEIEGYYTDRKMDSGFGLKDERKKTQKLRKSTFPFILKEEMLWLGYVRESVSKLQERMEKI